MPATLTPRLLAKVHADPLCAADAADLVYTSDDAPGITRRKRGRGFVYFDPSGERLTRGAELKRIAALAVPPAYTDVWICSSPNGHLQATGRDDRGRKQYRYHERWSQVRDAAKFEKMVQFAAALPKLRATVNRHLRDRGLGREKVLAACVKLLDRLFIRVGNDEYTKSNKSHGLTTLRDKHATFGRGGIVRFGFTGKHGVAREVELHDSGLARIVKQCQDLPGQELLQYVDDSGNVVDVTSGDVNAYLAEHAGQGITAKDFRTWHATVLAATALRDEQPADSKTGRNKQILAAVDRVAASLGNTRAVCRRCYIHPVAMDSFDLGELQGRMTGAPTARGLSGDEAATLALLRWGG